MQYVRRDICVASCLRNKHALRNFSHPDRSFQTRPHPFPRHSTLLFDYLHSPTMPSSNASSTNSRNPIHELSKLLEPKHILQVPRKIRSHRGPQNTILIRRRRVHSFDCVDEGEKLRAPKGFPRRGTGLDQLFKSACCNAFEGANAVEIAEAVYRGVDSERFWLGLIDVDSCFCGGGGVVGRVDKLDHLSNKDGLLSGRWICWGSDA